MTSLFTHPLVYPLIPELPLLLAMGLVSGPLRRASLLFAPWAAIPALVASLTLMLMPGVTLELPWLFLGTCVWRIVAQAAMGSWYSPWQ